MARNSTTWGPGKGFDHKPPSGVGVGGERKGASGKGKQPFAADSDTRQTIPGSGPLGLGDPAKIYARADAAEQKRVRLDRIHDIAFNLAHGVAPAEGMEVRASDVIGAVRYLGDKLEPPVTKTELTGKDGTPLRSGLIDDILGLMAKAKVSSGET
tara:strand:- start:221 stop:685 length:465 start_codon:yes stop_codon:yes gene_type:complete